MTTEIAELIKSQVEMMTNVSRAAMKAGETIGRLEADKDCLTLALRLYGEDENTYSPEVKAVMDKWRPRIESLLKGTPA